MASAGALILKGNLKLGANHAGVADMSAEVIAFKVSAKVDNIAIPATLSTPKAARGGSVEYSIDISYLSTDDDSATLFRVLWAAVGSASKELYFEGSFRDDAVSATNPVWYGTFIVSGADVGGAAEGLSEGSITCIMKAAPSMAIVAL